MKTDDQLWNIARLFRKAEAFDVVVDLLADIASIDEKLKKLKRCSPAKESIMREQLVAERGALEGALRRHVARLR